MSKLPVWARKPEHKKEVVATNRGWMVKETGEMLKLVKNLDERLKELHVESQESVESILSPSLPKENEQPEQVHTSAENPGETQGDKELPSETKQPVSEAEEKPKRRGRPRKNKKSTDQE